MCIRGEYTSPHTFSSLSVMLFLTCFDGSRHSVCAGGGLREDHGPRCVEREREREGERERGIDRGCFCKVEKQEFVCLNINDMINEEKHGPP